MQSIYALSRRTHAILTQSLTHSLTYLLTLYSPLLTKIEGLDLAHLRLSAQCWLGWSLLGWRVHVPVRVRALLNIFMRNLMALWALCMPCDDHSLQKANIPTYPVARMTGRRRQHAMLFKCQGSLVSLCSEDAVTPTRTEEACVGSVRSVKGCWEIRCEQKHCNIDAYQSTCKRTVEYFPICLYA